MLIELKDLEINPVDFREEFGPGVIDLGDGSTAAVAATQRGPGGSGRGASRQAQGSAGHPG